MATWRSGYAAACKAVYTGSIPVVASLRNTCKTPILASGPFRSQSLNRAKAAHRLPKVQRGQPKKRGKTWRLAPLANAISPSQATRRSGITLA